MKKFSGMIVIGLLAMFIGVIISIQITTTQALIRRSLFPLQKCRVSGGTETGQSREGTALQELNKLEERLDKIEKEKSDEDFILKGIVSDLEKYKMVAGVEDVKGPGVVVTVDDPLPTEEYSDEYSVNYAAF